jgi:tetratricopeptide (TPR) repeat protein
VALEQAELAERLDLPPSADPRDRARAISAALFERGLLFIRTQPLAWLGLELRKLRLTLGNQELSQDYDLLGEQEWVAAPLRQGLPFVVLLMLGTAGMVRGGGSVTGWLAVGQALVVLMSNLLLFTSMQHRLPLVVPLALFSGPGLCALLALARGRARSHWPVALSVLLASLFTIPARAPRTRVSMAHYFNTAIVQEQLGDLAGAAQQLTRALDRKPGSAEVLLERARVYRLLGQPALAARDLDQASAAGASAQVTGRPASVCRPFRTAQVLARGSGAWPKPRASVRAAARSSRHCRPAGDPLGAGSRPPSARSGRSCPCPHR